MRTGKDSNGWREFDSHTITKTNINLSQSVEVCGILYKQKYHINKLSTFTNWIRLNLDNSNETQKQIIKTN